MRLFVCVMLAAVAVAIAGCGGDDDDASDAPPSTPGASQPSDPEAQPPDSAPDDGAPPPGEEPSDGNAPGIPPLEGEIIETGSGLRYIDQAVGAGPVPTPTQCVTVHYTGWLTDGTQFDSSQGRAPVTFSLAGVIEGWTEGVGGMQAGGKRRLIIPGDLGYGPGGFPPLIGPNATLIFDVELISLGREPVIQAGRPTCPS
jgi:hypothetical protein